jgi:hypothetical protein
MRLLNSWRSLLLAAGAFFLMLSRDLVPHDDGCRNCSCVALVLRFRNQRLIKRRRAMTLTGILLALGCVIALLLFALFLWWCFGR